MLSSILYSPPVQIYMAPSPFAMYGRFTLMQLIVQYHNGSRLWCTCGWKPDELAAKFSGIGAFPGQEASSPEGMMDEKDIIRKMKELGLKVLD